MGESTAIPLVEGRGRARDKTREISGYVVWGLTGAAIAVPEIWAWRAGKSGLWPTISGTVGYLEYWHNIIAVIVIALLVWGAFHSVKYTRRTTDKQAHRTPGGRYALSSSPERGPIRVVSAIMYYTLALACVIGGPLLVTQVRPHDKYLLGEALYGAMGVFLLVLPALAGAIWGKDVPFTTLFVTVQNIEEKARIVAIIFAAGITVLLVHLAFYPWPAVIPDLQDLHKQNAKLHHAQLKQKEPNPYGP